MCSCVSPESSRSTSAPRWSAGSVRRSSLRAASSSTVSSRSIGPCAGEVSDPLSASAASGGRRRSMLMHWLCAIR
jgi:hypothetical protein